MAVDDLILRALQSIREDVAEIKDDAKEVKRQVTIQNGRIRKLELWRHGMDAVAQSRGWRWPAVVGFATGAGVVIIGEVTRLLLG